MKCCINLILLFVFLLIFYKSSANDDSDGGSESGEGDSAESESGSGDENETMVKRSTAKGKRSKEVTLPEILDVSINAITSEKTTEKQLRDLLLKHYFTDKKEMSIWPKAVEETEKTLGVEFQERELFDMENDVKNIYRRMLECELNSKKKKASRAVTARCFLTLREYIDDGKVDFSLPRGSIEGQAKMLEMHIAYNIMSLLILKLAEKKAQEARVSYFKAANYTLHIASSLVETCKIATNNTIDGRLQAISQTEICLMQECLWQEFQVSCEFRSKRSLGGSETGIGGEGDIFVQRYRAKVIDNVEKLEICNLALSTNSTTDAKAVKASLARQCASKRSYHAKNVKREITKFYSTRTLPIVKNLCKLWGCDEEKLKNIAMKLTV